jgi:hypothetical protein
MQYDHEKLKTKIHELDKAVSGLQQNTGRLLSIINRPGFTTLREGGLVYAHVEALHRHVVATHESYVKLIEEADEIGKK